MYSYILMLIHIYTLRLVHMLKSYEICILYVCVYIYVYNAYMQQHRLRELVLYRELLQ